MAYGLGTYCYFWRNSSYAPEPLTVEQMLHNTRELGGDVFQICDYPLIETFDDARLAGIRATADDLGITLELGTRGIRRDHLAAYLELAGKLGVTLVRSMMNTAEHRPGPAEATALLRESVPAYADRGVTLGLETYEQVSTDVLLDVVRAVDDPHLGIVLDPGNSVAALERPRRRRGGHGSVCRQHARQGLRLHPAGRLGRLHPRRLPAGRGPARPHHMIETVRPEQRGINQIVEHWLPWQDEGFEATVRLEDQWTRHSITTL